MDGILGQSRISGRGRAGGRYVQYIPPRPDLAPGMNVCTLGLVSFVPGRPPHDDDRHLMCSRSLIMFVMMMMVAVMNEEKKHAPASSRLGRQAGRR